MSWLGVKAVEMDGGDTGSHKTSDSNIKAAARKVFVSIVILVC